MDLANLENRFASFAKENRLRLQWNGAKQPGREDAVERLVLGSYGELADMGDCDPDRFRLRLLAVPRAKRMNKALLARRRAAIEGGLELKWKADAESIFYFRPDRAEQVELAIRLVGAKRRRVMSETQWQAAADRLAKAREQRAA